jgi:DNA-binding response OmpR family regulator
VVFTGSGRSTMAAHRILLIEDETGARQALESLLGEEGYDVCSAATGRAGLDRMRDFQPDTVVCDFLLPDIDGLQVLRQVRRNGGSEVTFIVMTAGCGGEAAERTVELEADFFFKKPVDLRRLRRVLEDPSSGLSTGVHHGMNGKGATHEPPGRS